MVQATMTRTDSLATLTFEISEGRLCHVSVVLVRGNATVRTGTALRAGRLMALIFPTVMLVLIAAKLYPTIVR